MQEKIASASETDRITMKRHFDYLIHSSDWYLAMLNGQQNSLKRFLYCCAEKLLKSTKALQKLYDLAFEDHDLEFPMGVIIRSLLMDSILTQSLRFHTLQVTEENYAQTVATLDQQSLILIADGTAHLIKQFIATDQIHEVDKRSLTQQIAGQFPGLFYVDPKTSFPMLKAKYKVQLAELHKQSAHENQFSHQKVYNLYSHYSKYDHVSHWTSILSNLSWEDRLYKINSSIVMIMLNYRDLLVIGQFLMDIRLSIPPMLEKLDEHMKETHTQI